MSMINKDEFLDSLVSDYDNISVMLLNTLASWSRDLTFRDLWKHGAEWLKDKDRKRIKEQEISKIFEENGYTFK